MAVEQFATTIGDTPIAAYNAERMELAHTAVLPIVRVPVGRLPPRDVTEVRAARSEALMQRRALHVARTRRGLVRVVALVHVP